MGADIHMYIQYKNKKSNYWNCFADRINPGRNYTMFAILAKVRGEFPESFEPKGIPEHELSYSCKDDLYLYVDDKLQNEDGFTSLEKALKWKENHGCKIIEKNGEPYKVEHPDWHSHTWLTIKELKKAYKLYLKYASEEWGEDVKIPSEYQAILDVMKSLKKSGNKVELVFWFDN